LLPFFDEKLEYWCALFVQKNVPSKERMTASIIFADTNPLIYEKFICQFAYVPPLHNVADRNEYGEHEKYFFWPLWNRVFDKVFSLLQICPI